MCWKNYFTSTLNDLLPTFTIQIESAKFEASTVRLSVAVV